MDVGVTLLVTFEFSQFFASVKLLDNFSQQASAWRHCVFFMQKSGNNYVLMYSLKVLEVSHQAKDNSL